MRTGLLHRERTLDLRAEPPPGADELTTDLGLASLLEAVAGGDPLLADVARQTLLRPLATAAEIAYRQAVLDDCRRQREVVEQLYAIALDALEARSRIWFGVMRDSPGAILHESVELLDLLLERVRRLRALADRHAQAFRSEGFRAFFATVARDLDDRTLLRLERHVATLRLRRGLLASARLGHGAKGVDYVLRRPSEQRPRIVERIAALARRDTLSYQVPDRDEAGARALEELRGRALNRVADTAARAAEHVLGFFTSLRDELAFHRGCLNLEARLQALGMPTCTPAAVDPGPRRPLSATGLYDPCLALRAGRPVVGNDLDADGRALVIVTGANQGGKSTLLRAIGLAQLMTQAGMPVAAERFEAELRERVHTHFRREEDADLRHGKLDEELARMDAIADRAGPRDLVLLNESFASTNEHEGTLIATGIVQALLDAGLRVVYVTHMHELASHWVEQPATTLFLRAERAPDGRRSFRLRPGEPLPTSHAADLYQRIFATDAETDPTELERAR